MRVASDETSLYQTAKLGVKRVRSGPGGVRKFGDGKDYFSIQVALFGEKVLPVQSFHGRQTRISTLST